MPKNITLRLEEAVLRSAKEMAFKLDISLSQWVSQLIIKTVHQKKNFQSAQKRALKRLEKGFDLEGAPLERDRVYER